MINIEIPGDGDLILENLVLDVTGALAADGQLLSGMADQFLHPTHLIGSLRK